MKNSQEGPSVLDMGRTVASATAVAARQATEGEFSHCNPDDLIYVDTCSNIEGGLIKNARLLTKIRVVKNVRWVRGINGTMNEFKVNKRGYLPIFGWVWYSPRASHNILSFWDINERCTDSHYDKCGRSWRFVFRRSSSTDDSAEEDHTNHDSSSMDGFFDGERESACSSNEEDHDYDSDNEQADDEPKYQIIEFRMSEDNRMLHTDGTRLGATCGAYNECHNS